MAMARSTPAQSGAQRLDILNRFDQMDASYAIGTPLAHGALDLWMPSVTDQNHIQAGSAQPGNFHVYLGNQWAGGIKNTQPTNLSFLAYGLGHPRLSRVSRQPSC